MKIPNPAPLPLTADGRSARWQQHREQRRDELIRTARRAVHALGPQASMEEIAAAAGTSKSVFYRYFGDKAGLQRAVGEVVIGTMQHKLLEAATTATGPREGLRSMVSVYLQMAETSPNVYTFVTRTGAESGEDTPAALTHFFTAITTMMAEQMGNYLAARNTPEQLRAAADFWPPAALGMVRAAGEAWLATPDAAHKPSRTLMTDQITTWLYAGITHDSAPVESIEEKKQ